MELLRTLVEQFTKHRSLIGHDGLSLFGELGIGGYLGQEFTNGLDNQTVRAGVLGSFRTLNETYLN